MTGVTRIARMIGNLGAGMTRATGMIAMTWVIRLTGMTSMTLMTRVNVLTGITGVTRMSGITGMTWIIDDWDDKGVWND